MTALASALEAELSLKNALSVALSAAWGAKPSSQAGMANEDEAQLAAIAQAAECM
jgi:hypothetical protein